MWRNSVQHGKHDLRTILLHDGWVFYYCPYHPWVLKSLSTTITLQTRPLYHQGPASKPCTLNLWGQEHNPVQRRKEKKCDTSGTESESTDDEDDRHTKWSSKTNHQQSKHARCNESDAEVVEVGAGWSNEGSGVWIPDAFDKTWNTNVSTNRHLMIRADYPGSEHSGAKLPETPPTRSTKQTHLHFFSDKCMVKFTHTRSGLRLQGGDGVTFASKLWCVESVINKKNLPVFSRHDEKFLLKKRKRQAFHVGSNSLCQQHIQSHYTIY